MYRTTGLCVQLMPTDIENGVGVYDIIYTHHGQPNEQQNVCQFAQYFFTCYSAFSILQIIFDWQRRINYFPSTIFCP